MDWQAQLRSLLRRPDFDQVFEASDEEEKRVASQRMLDFRGNQRPPPAPTWMEELQTLWRGLTGAQELPQVWDTQHGIRDADALYRGPHGVPAAATPKMQAAPNTLYPRGDVSQQMEDILTQFSGPPVRPSGQELERLLWEQRMGKAGPRT